MRIFHGLFVAFAVVTLITWAAADDKKPDNAKLIVGTWEVTKAEASGITLSDTIEFGADGKFKANHTSKGGKVEVTEASYKVDGDKVTVTIPKGGSASADKVETLIINKLTDTECVLAGESGKTVEFKRKKGS